MSRDSSRLLLPLHNGTNAVLVDFMSGEPSGITYSYLGVAQGLDAYLIEVQYYEGSSHLLVWRNTGTRTPLDAVPLVAPGGQRLLTASADLDIQYNPNRVRVYRVGRDSLILEWELEPETWEPVNTRWTSDSSFLVKRGRSFLELDTAAALRPLRMVHVTGSWTLDSVSFAP